MIPEDFIVSAVDIVTNIITDESKWYMTLTCPRCSDRVYGFQTQALGNLARMAEEHIRAKHMDES